MKLSTVTGSKTQHFVASYSSNAQSDAFLTYLHSRAFYGTYCILPQHSRSASVHCIRRRSHTSQLRNVLHIIKYEILALGTPLQERYRQVALNWKLSVCIHLNSIYYLTDSSHSPSPTHELQGCHACSFHNCRLSTSSEQLLRPINSQNQSTLLREQRCMREF